MKDSDSSKEILPKLNWMLLIGRQIVLKENSPTYRNCEIWASKLSTVFHFPLTFDHYFC